MEMTTGSKDWSLRNTKPAIFPQKEEKGGTILNWKITNQTAYQNTREPYFWLGRVVSNQSWNEQLDIVYEERRQSGGLEFAINHS